MPLTLIYDSHCPLCAHEVAMLARRDRQGRLDLVDLHSERFDQDFPTLDRRQANAVLHARDAAGQWHLGLDATLLAWRAVGLGAWIAPLRWPLIRRVADAAYTLFARHRHRLTRWLKLSQENCQCCDTGSFSLQHRHAEPDSED